MREDQLKDGHASMTSSHGVGTKGTIIEVVEEALKWRLEANNKKQGETIQDLQERFSEQKRQLDMLSNDNGNEILELKN